MDDWRSPAQRNAVIQKLEAVMKESGGSSNFQNQSPVELEKTLFEKSKSKDEYSSFFRNTVLMMSRNKTSQQAQMPSGAGMVSGRSNQHMMGQHNPMGYSQNFQYGGGAGGVGGMNPGAGGNQVPNPNFPAGGGGAGGGMGMPGHPQQPPQYSMYPPGGNPGSHMQQHYPPGMGVQQGYPRTASNYQGIGMTNYPQGGYSQQGMVAGQRGAMHSSMMRPTPPGMVPPGVQPPGVMMRQGIQSGQFMVDNGGQQVHAIPNPYSSSMRSMNTSTTYSIGTSGTTSTQVPSGHGGPVPFNMAPSSNPGGMQGSSQNAPPSSTHGPATSSVSTGGTSAEGGSSHQAVPPNISDSSIANPPTPSMFAGVASPAPPTPVYPVSPAVSTQGVASNQPAMTAEENEAYIRKLNELQKYIPVMSEWINRLSKDDKKSDQYTKLKSLHSLLQNPSKRVALPTLMKCETALERMFDKNPDKTNPSSVPPLSVSSTTGAVVGGASSTPVSAPSSVPESKLPVPPQQSQSLLDFKMTRSPPPTYSNLRGTIPRGNDTIDRIPASIKRRLLPKFKEEDDDDDTVPQLPPEVRRELMYLDQFDVKVKPMKNQTSKEIVLECSLGANCHLPKVPPLIVVLPHEYPSLSPQCDLTHYLQVAASPFIKKVGELLSNSLSKRAGRYTFSTLLNSWQSCVLDTIFQMLNEEP